MTTEKRLIDAYALDKKMFYVEEMNGGHGWVVALEDISKAPTVDAVEVVYCEECKWRNTRGCPYMNFNAAVRDDSDYCSDGERKDND